MLRYLAMGPSSAASTIGSNDAIRTTGFAPMKVPANIIVNKVLIKMVGFVEFSLANPAVEGGKERRHGECSINLALGKANGGKATRTAECLMCQLFFTRRHDKGMLHLVKKCLYS